MMSVLEYANDINKKVSEVLKVCQNLEIKATNEEDMLTDDAITQLDIVFNSEETYEEEIEDEDIEIVVDNKKVDTDSSISKQKLKKKADIISSKNDLANKKKALYKSKEKLTSNAPVTNQNVVLYKEDMTIAELAVALNVSSSELIKKLFSLGVMATLNLAISFENAEILVLEYNKELKKEATADVANFEEFEILDNDADLIERPPVVTIMGHVDHGKTTLLDTIRKASVASGEAGGITQAISAYHVKCHDKIITFIDTPGHAAFTEMRARGAGITDIVIIIVAADDGVMPQTKEAIDHAKAAGVPIIVAINKIDKPGANIDRVMNELAEYGLVPDVWGGETVYTKISAKDGTGIEDLLESILLVAEMQSYKANPNRYAVGTVIEARLDKQVGAIVTLLIQNGTLRIGDPIVVGNLYGKVRTLKNDMNEEITAAGPSMPVEITGLNETPGSGDRFMAFGNEKEARNVADQRKVNNRAADFIPKTNVTLEDLFSNIKEGVKEINVIVKADVNGSSEAVKNSLEKIDIEGVRVKVVRSSVGAITESDVVLASASNAVLIGFNVRPNNTIKEYAKENGVEIRLYNIIYKAVEDMEAAMKGMLDPVFEEKILGTAEVRQIFKFSKIGIIAGSYVTDGIIKRDSKARIIRDGVVIYDGAVNSLQREKDTMKEVKKGLECGITIENYNDVKNGDVIEAYEMVEIKRN